MAKQLSRQIKKIEANEKKGAYGAWRSEFCGKYHKLLTRIQQDTHRSLVETLAPKGEMITCRKGCTHCCFHYVTVPLAHGMVIVDYLYKRKGLLKQFIDNFDRWYGKGYSISDSIDRIRIRASSSSMPVEQVMADTRLLSVKYLDINIPCPFLVNNRCFIYEVRPTSCSGHFAVSPPDCCAPDSKRKPVLHNIIPGDRDLIETTQLADPIISLYQLTLPIMIHKLITEGALSIMKEIK